MAKQHVEPSAERYDVIVAGGGLGGITAGALLAKGGRRVLVVDRQDGPGGYAHTFRRGPYVFDPAVHITAQGGRGLPFDILMRVLGVAEQVEFTPVGSMYGVSFPGLREHLPIGREAFLDAHARHFPREREGLRRFLQLAAQVTRESQELSPQVALRDLDRSAARYPTLFKHRNRTVSQAIDESIKDPRARALVTTSWPYLGLPPDELSFFSWSGMLMSMLDDSPFYSKGSFQRVADAFVTSLTRAGGEFVPRTTVEKILVEDGKAAGVRLEGGRVVRAPIVVSNVDARQTYEELVGPEHLPASFLRNFRRLRPSLSAVVVYAAFG